MSRVRNVLARQGCAWPSAEVRELRVELNII